MHNMWPMMRLDARTVVSGSSLGFLAVLLPLLALLTALGQAAVSLPMAAAVALSLSLSIFYAHATYGLPRLYGTLPVRRSTVIVSHYLVASGLFVAVIASAGVMIVIGALLRGEPAVGSLLAVGVVFGVLSLVTAPQLPVIIRFGPETARVVLLIVAGVVALAIVALGFLGRGGRIEAVLSSDLPWAWLVGGIVSVGVVAWGLSLLVSLRIYQSQDH